MSNTTYKKEVYVFYGLLAISLFLRGIIEHIRIMQYIGLLGIRGAMMLLVQNSISEQQKECFRTYGVVLFSILLICSTVYGLLSTNRLLVGSMWYICLTMLRAVDTKFGQHLYRGSSHVAYHDILYLFAVAVATSICVYFLLGMQEEIVFTVTTITLLVILFGNRLLGSSRTHMFKQIKIWLLILLWGVFAVWQFIELFLHN